MKYSELHTGDMILFDSFNCIDLVLAVTSFDRRWNYKAFRVWFTPNAHLVTHLIDGWVCDELVAGRVLRRGTTASLQEDVT